MAAPRSWAEQLAAWALPDGFADRAPGRDAWRLDPDSFVERALARRHVELGGTATADAPAEQAARAALGAGGTVLDVGCGAGAATVALGRPVTGAVGSDERPEMLAAYERVLDDCGVPAATVVARWPDDAAVVPTADVVVCHHVVYNVADLAGLLRALDAHARRRVVLAAPLEHPLAWTAPYWRALHGIERPTGPTLEHLLAACDGLGLAPEVAVRREPAVLADRDRRLAHLAEHLCLRDDELPALAAVDDDLPPPVDRAVAGVWWDR